jgi:hypothetical protein
VAGAERAAHADQLAMHDLGADDGATARVGMEVFHGVGHKVPRLYVRANKKLIPRYFSLTPGFLG